MKKRGIKTRLSAFALAVSSVALMSLPVAAQAGALENIKARGSLRCSAHNGSSPGFFEIDEKGQWKGFDIQFCKAVGAAILGDAQKVTYVPVSWAQRFPALQSGDVDVLFKATGWTLSRDATQGADFSIPYFQGGFQLMVSKSSNASKPADLDGATLCTAAGTSLEPILADYMSKEGITFKIVTFEKSEELLAAYETGRCDVYAGWGPSLAATRATKMKSPDDHIILPVTLSLEPIAAAVKSNDKPFQLVVTYVIAALIRAEELGITSQNVEKLTEDLKANPASNPAAARLLGVQGDYGKTLGLPANWAAVVIKSVGNYGQVFERELGSGSPYKLDRGLNKLWNKGGLIYAPVLD